MAGTRRKSSRRRSSRQRRKSSDRRRRSRKSSSKKSFVCPRSGDGLCKRCQQTLGAKIGANTREMRDKKRYVSRQQAIAVAYSQVRSKCPKCKRCFK